MMPARYRVLSLFLLFTAAVAAADQVVPVGGEWVVHSTTASQQGFADVATNGLGQFVAAWESDGQDGDGFGIIAQRLTPAGERVGAEILVNSTTMSEQFDAAVGVRADGSFVVTWASLGQDGSGFGIYAQAFDAAGMPVGGEMAVNTFTTNDQNYPDIAIGADGGFWIVWESAGQDNSFSGVYAQRFDSANMKVGDEFRVNTSTLEEQDQASVVAVSDGFWVIWESRGIDSSGDAVMIQRFDAAGLPIGDETQVNTTFSNDQEDPDIAVLPNGTFAVVWESDGQDGSGEAVVGQVFDAGGNPIGGEVLINETLIGNQEDPRIAMVGDSTFFVVWTGDTLANGTDIFGRQLDATGMLTGNEMRLNTAVGDDQDVSTVVGDANGRSIAAWRAFGGHDGDGAGVLAQRFDLALFADGFESGNTLMWDSQSP